MLDCQIKKNIPKVTIRRCEIKMAFNGDGLEFNIANDELEI